MADMAKEIVKANGFSDGRSFIHVELYSNR